MYRLEYIYHDCFLLETEEAAVVFDYWKDPRSENQNLPELLTEISDAKRLYVLVSHFHKDHFNKTIFKWKRVHQDIHYIISPDVKRQIRYMLDPNSHYAGEKIAPELVSVIRKGEVYEDEHLSIHAFGSTDIGNSYAIVFKASSLQAFHAGDLNCWAWRDESTPEEIASAEKAYRTELKAISSAFPEFGLAMFPVDSRIGSGYAQGAYEFVRAIKVGLFVPMHYGLGETPEEQKKYLRDAMNFKEYANSEGEYLGFASPHDEIFSYWNS